MTEREHCYQVEQWQRSFCGNGFKCLFRIFLFSFLHTSNFFSSLVGSWVREIFLIFSWHKPTRTHKCTEWTEHCCVAFEMGESLRKTKITRCRPGLKSNKVVETFAAMFSELFFSHYFLVNFFLLLGINFKKLKQLTAELKCLWKE